MKLRLELVLATCVGWSLIQLPARGEDRPAVTNIQDRLAYALGVNVGGYILRFQRSGFDLNRAELMEAIQDVLDGQPKMTDTEARQVIALDQQQKLHERIDKNVKEGEAFLAQNKTNAGVKVRSLPLPDGQTAELQYTVITEGTGAAPQAHDIVTVNYRGTLINGKEFDNSAKRGGQPFKCNVSGVIRGMSEALQSMKVGSKWKLYMPASLAYGERGTSGVEPGSALIIELELLSDEPGPAPKPVTSDIIRVPSADEMKAGAKIEVIKADDLDKKSATGQTNQAKTGS